MIPLYLSLQFRHGPLQAGQPLSRFTRHQPMGPPHEAEDDGCFLDKEQSTP